jgi:hypothetical protein
MLGLFLVLYQFYVGKLISMFNQLLDPHSLKSFLKAVAVVIMLLVVVSIFS